MPAVSIVLPVLLDLSAVVVEIYGENVVNENPYSIDALGMNLPAVDLSGCFWYLQDASGANPDLVSCWQGDQTWPKDKDGVTTQGDNPPWLLMGSPSLNFNSDLNKVLDNFVVCSGASFASDYASLPNSTYSPTSPLYKFANFYQAILGRLAFDVFGHPLAQAGIENDTELMASMKDHNIGVLLKTALQGLTEAQIRLIYNQMIQQDISRFSNISDVSLDLSGVVTAASPESLQFQAGDIITFEVTMASSEVKRGASGVIDDGPGNVTATTSVGQTVLSPGKGAFAGLTRPITYAVNVTLA